MDTTNIVSILSLAFGLGLLHALDADHIMAVSGLASTRVSLRNCVRFCLRWAIGHGASLLIIGMCVFALGLAIPHSLSSYAENAVGFILIIIGLWIIIELFSKNAHFHFHKHDGLPEHAHWHQHPNRPDGDTHHHKHGPIIVGLLHGTAGSAPLLVLIPMAQLHSPWIGVAYLLVFSLGVLLAMLFFGGLLGNLYKQLLRWSGNAVRILRLLIAMSAIGFGLHLLTGSL